MTVIRLQTHDSALGRWVHGDCCPPDLAGIVERIWYFEGRMASRWERVLPNGRPELTVHLGPSYRRVTDDGAETFSTVCVNGLMLRPEVIEAPEGPSAVLGIRFFPAGAFAVLQHPLHELTNLTVDVADLIGSAATELSGLCEAASTPEERIRAAVGWVKRRVARGGRPTPAVLWTAGEIERSRGTASIATLLQKTGWSKSRFAAHFKEEIGVPPKQLARLIRFRRALDLLHRSDESLSSIALNAGYYDQPHLNAEFREFAGLSPGAFKKAMRYPESVNLVEESRRER